MLHKKGDESMAIINCPECGKEISDKAKTCIHCGWPVNEEKPEAEPIASNSVVIIEDHKKSAQKKLLISTILSLIGTITIDSVLASLLFSFEREPVKDADVNITVSQPEHISSFAKFLEGDAGMMFLLFIFLLPFVFSLVLFIVKNKSKKFFCIPAVLFCFVAATFLILFNMTESSTLCFGPIFYAPIVLFIISAFLNIIGTKEYFNNAEQK